MNYFIANLFSDWKWWARLGFTFVATMNMFDIISQGRFFNLWMVKSTVGAAFIGLIVYMVRLHQQEKKYRQIEILLPTFMAERREYLEKKAAADPKFQTFCFDCLHYDSGRRCCNLRLHNREIKIKLNPYDTFSYCLYWNLNDHPLLALTERLVSKGDSHTR